jgi:hypothetical protein
MNRPSATRATWWFEARNDWKGAFTERGRTWVNAGVSLDVGFPRPPKQYRAHTSRTISFHLGILGFHFYATRTSLPRAYRQPLQEMTQ